MEPQAGTASSIFAPIPRQVTIGVSVELLGIALAVFGLSNGTPELGVATAILGFVLHLLRI